MHMHPWEGGWGGGVLLGCFNVVDKVFTKCNRGTLNWKRKKGETEEKKGEIVGDGGLEYLEDGGWSTWEGGPGGGGGGLEYLVEGCLDTVNFGGHEKPDRYPRGDW